jgi:4-hydroxybenzoate polyprenyltransferase
MRPFRAARAADERRMSVPILWLLVILLVIFAIFGGVAINSLLWLVLIVALVVAVLALL